ncbi:hypothetical protein ROHU_035011 [Labeo rohita]|uniref:Uncharacterized protein n=1 Tax=Labeo rohita TaxID=84645 RepID=A0A498LAT0_LABRO|nr:hypothetical protein ROHU_035011 [Labeo rohita]
MASEGSARFTLAAVQHLARRERVRAVPLRTLPEALRRVVRDRVPTGNFQERLWDVIERLHTRIVHQKMPHCRPSVWIGAERRVSMATT